MAAIQSIRRTTISEFRGADLRSDPAEMHMSRSPSCVNMMRGAPNQVRKRMGYTPIARYPYAINGRYWYKGQEVVHTGTRLYVGTGVKFTGMANAPSMGFCMGDWLYILDGTHYICYDGTRVRNVSDVAYAPTVMISRNPDGTGGTVLEEKNLLTGRWTDSFYPDGVATDYQLSFSNLDDSGVKVYAIDSKGENWEEMFENIEYTVNRTTGVVTFTEAPPKSPVEGADGLRITASRSNGDQALKITGGDICTVYDETGLGTRVFVTGCTAYPNRDFWSAQQDPTYFPDVNYSVLGQSNARIMGYSRIGGSLAAHKGAPENAIFVRTAETVELSDGTQSLVFRTGSVLPSHTPLSRFSFAALDGEPLYLTDGGVCALTSTTPYGSRCEQGRSYFIDPALRAEDSPELAKAVVFQDFYVLAFPNGHVYLLDGHQKSYVKEQPYSSFQYECFYWDNVPATQIWVHENRLYFGTQNGYIYRFYDDPTAAISYNDNGAAIAAEWQTPEFTGTRFDAAKSFRRYSIRLNHAGSTSMNGAYRVAGGAWTPLADTAIPVRRWQFSKLKFSALSFGSRTGGCTVRGRMAVHGTERLALRVGNNALHEPFGLSAIAVDYTQAGDAKR